MHQLFVSFFRTGLGMFGGGLAMLPVLEREVVERRKWTSSAEILDIYALAQTVPGVIAVNTAIYFGFRLAGWRGALAAVAGVVAPSVLVILLIAAGFEAIMASPTVASGFVGIKGAVAGLLLAVAVRFLVASCRSRRAILIATAAFSVSVLTDLSPIWVLATAGVVGFLWREVSS